MHKNPQAKSSLNPTRNQIALYFGVSLIAILFSLYTLNLTTNPPGFYVDEATFAYNAYCLAKTGAGEFGVRWPLFFQHYERPFTVFGNPVHMYLLAGLFMIFPPSIWLARLLSALTGFVAGLLLGFLGFKVSGKQTIGMIMAITALVTPWFFEFSRWFSDASYYPLMLALFFLALYRAHLKPRWSWQDVIAIAITLGLLTYTYTIGRLFGPLLAVGIVIFATNRGRLVDVVKTWVAYGITLGPLFVFYVGQPYALSSRFATVSYLRTETTLQGLLVRFLTRYFQDLSLTQLLVTGDANPRHHVAGATGSILAATVLLAVIGLVIVLVNHRDNPWWRYILFGTFASVIPGALTSDPFHTGRMIAYPVFLLVLTIPALDWLMEKSEAAIRGETRRRISGFQFWRRWPTSSKRAALIVILLATIVQASYFQVVFWRDGYDRNYFWDATYEEAYDVATATTSRPIYLVDGKWGPGYVIAFWYAALEGRSKSEFVHLPYRVQAPQGALVISSEEKCSDCQIIFDNNHYIVYRKL
ncbi:MAG TPA: glycosyltransferase family 39 protein [Pyrinomonadaceae bacterium]|nr:glycosyltransferase family 39 protein [Pyrinomonadaceae bacterium]